MLADAGVENVNALIDALMTWKLLRRVLAFTELRFSNSMIEAWWRSLKHQWLFLHPLDSGATVRRLVAFYVDEHNGVVPHRLFRGQTPDEMYSAPERHSTGRPGSPRGRRTPARREANRSASCESCRPTDVAACAPKTKHTRRRRPIVPLCLEARAAGTGANCPLPL